MNVTCENCQKRYTLADEKVRGKTVRIRCKACQALMTVVGPPEGADESTVAMSKAETDRLRAQAARRELPWEDAGPSGGGWHAMVRGVQKGPLSPAQLKEGVLGGDITPASFLWKEGMAEWRKGGDLPELASLFALSEAPAGRAAPPAPPVEEAVLSGLQMMEDRRNTSEGRTASPAADPFSAAFQTDPAFKAPPGEATRFFILQSGVNKKNPPWKIALFVLVFLGLPLGFLYTLNALNIVPLQVTRIDDAGNEVRESVFSSEGMSGLADLLTGKKKQKALAQAARKTRSPEREKPGDSLAAQNPSEPETLEKPASGEPQAFNLEQMKADVGPALKAQIEQKATDSTTAGLSEEAVAKVVSGSQAAFMQCVEQELRKNPNFKGGKVNIIATVGPSGVVRGATLDRRDLEASSVGLCLKSRAKKMVFPSFAGDSETEVHIPLILTSSM